MRGSKLVSLKEEGELRRALLLVVEIAVRNSGNAATEGEGELGIFSCSFLRRGFLCHGLFNLLGAGNLNLPGGGNADADGPFSGFQNGHLDVVANLNRFVDFAG